MAGIALAVAVVIAHVALVPSGWSARLLSLPPLPVLGRISYGVYLWHWPVFIAANADRTGLDGLTLFAVRCLLTVGVASLSYVLVERPIQLRVRPRRPVFVATGAGVAIAAGAAGAGGDDRGASTAVATGGGVGRHRGGRVPGGRR